MKQCFKCLKTLPLTEFYNHSRMADGHLNKCISCTKNDVHNNYAINKLNLTYRLQERKRNRNKWHRLYSKKVIKQNSIVKVRWNHKNSYKRNTQNQLRRAIKKE